MKEAVGASKSSLTPPLQGIIRVGNFEVDVRAGELRRAGVKVKLSGQPFDVLVALLEKPGQIVTREELHDKLWSQDTFVDFEQGLNKAINRVRDTLGDDADNPRFIATLPRRGYKFIAPVEALPKANGCEPDVVRQPVELRKSLVTTARISAGSMLLLLFIAGAIIWCSLPHVPKVTNV